MKLPIILITSLMLSGTIDLETGSDGPSSPGVQVGQQVPSFSLDLLDYCEQLTDKDLLGRYYLLSFWSIGCAPCIREIPNLEQAHSKYRDSGFTIISLSISRSEEDVLRFRDEHAEMPWLHAVVTGNREILERFGARGTPHLILVSPEGTVLATSRELVGKALHRTLAAHLGGS